MSLRTLIDMETDSFFYQLFQQLPQTLFELLGLPAARATAYRFDSVELKKAFRIDGLFVPKKSSLPLYFVEVQFQRMPTFYANLFAKVFSYLEENDPKQEWIAVAIFPTRKEEPTHLGPYEDLLRSKRVKRIYLEDVAKAKDPPVGLGLLQLLFASEKEAQELAPRVVQKAKTDFADSDLHVKVVELMERLLLRRFPQYDREAMRVKFKLHDIRESKVVKEAIEEEKKEMIERWLAKGMSHEEIAGLLEISVAEVRRLMNGLAN
jgi:predicted transposase/invertase (TIGR01784 family)